MDKNEEAIKAYDTAIMLNPYYASAYHNKGIVLNILKAHTEALNAFNKAIELNPNNSDYIFVKGATLLIIGGKLIEEKQFEKADRVLRNKIFNKINDDQTNEAFSTFKGICLFHRKKYHKALIQLNYALTLNPNSPSANKFKLNCLNALGLKIEVKKEQNKQLTKDINNIDVLLEKALSLLQEEKIEEAEKFFRRAERLGIDKKFGDNDNSKKFQICYLSMKAIYLQDQKKYYEALKSINEALGFKMKYEELNLYRRKAELLSSIGHYKPALDCCNYVLTNESEEISEVNRRRVLLVKAISYYELGEIEEAEQLIKVYNLNQDPQMVKEEIGKLLYFPKKD
ncbi:tetratricopeptide repeat protein [Rickettsia endosymbiont of Polydrusus tereticollis]|uniref:tetratricopeptide repeat protein n=1 Tax=Rickettsia endosymbiont of Polydrusus tereticollis TaxID=3066251 RepID=UPI0031333B17